MATQMTIQRAMELLNVQEPLTEKKVKAAYRALQKKNHPDANLSVDSTATSQDINVAHDLLKKELEYRGSKYHKEEDLSIIREDTKQKMYNMIYVDLEKLDLVSFNYMNYLNNLYLLFKGYMNMVEVSSSKGEIEAIKEQFEQNVFLEMNRFANRFFTENPHLKIKKKENFKSLSEQLVFYSELIKKYETEYKHQIIPVVENTLEYRLAQKILGFNQTDLNDIIIRNVRSMVNGQPHIMRDDDIRKIAIEVLRNSMKEVTLGKSILCLIDFLKEAEAVSLLSSLLEKFSFRGYMNRIFLEKVIHLSVNRIEYSPDSPPLDVYQNITFDRDFYLENVWNDMSNFLGIKMREQNFARNKNINLFLDYMLEILELASNGIITVDTLMEVEQGLVVDYATEDILLTLQFALNICSSSTDLITNPDYLFISLEENRENPFLILHRLKKNYEIVFENELGMFQKMEMKKPTLEKIDRYLPIRRIILDGDFIGKKIGDLDVLYLYNGFYLTMDYYGKTVLYKKEHLDSRKFTDGDSRLGDADSVLLILCEQANEKYGNWIEKETGYMQKKIK